MSVEVNGADVILASKKVKPGLGVDDRNCKCFPDNACGTCTGDHYEAFTLRG